MDKTKFTFTFTMSPYEYMATAAYAAWELYDSCLANSIKPEQFNEVVISMLGTTTIDEGVFNDFLHDHSSEIAEKLGIHLS